MSALCCIGLSVASRIIGTYTLALSILIINVFMSHFFIGNHEHDFFGTVESWAPIGLHWALVFKYFRLDRQSQVIAICSYAIFVYSMLFLISSAYLTYGSITRKSKYAVPWLYMQMISIIDQSTALGIQLIHERYDVFDKSTWYIPLCCIYLLLNAYFWMVVQSSRREWSKNIENQQISQISGNLTDEVTTKSPSYVSLSFMTNQSSYQPSNTLPFYDTSNSMK
ncbi:uncharacterized protein LOC118439721 isoform X1 [Vespa mandarinia]|uniref:uncharacterized protein LOC118439721 isoform X1 n=1 Tax=Vespa mandarinia TaxID=7446 RepID=UPI00160D1284|nr:uncharacterized protein LOC118439721 isoform X1 [Vespa mandarinia]